MPMSLPEARKELRVFLRTIEAIDNLENLDEEQRLAVSRFKSLSYVYVQQLLWDLAYAETRKALRTDDD